MQKKSITKTAPAQLKQKVPKGASQTRIEEPCELHNGDDLVMRYVPNFFTEKEKRILFNYLKGLKVPNSNRTSGISCRSLIFGYAPRDPLKNLPCRLVKNEKHKGLYPGLNYMIQKIEDYLESQMPEIAKRQKEINEQIEPNWKFKSGLFTSGILNKSNQLVYHTDNGNVKGTLSAMVCFKKSVTGGDLHLPEYDVDVDISDGSLIIFDGQGTSHGVRPFHLNNKGGDRFTLVFYSLNNLKHCSSCMADEYKYINSKTMRKLS